MPLTRKEAEEISTKPEFELVEASFRPNVNSLTATQLRSKITRARKLQDKYRDLSRKQNRETKDEAPAKKGKANARTERKARLFDETRERFEKRLEQVETRAAADEGKKQSGASPGRATRRSTSREAAAGRRKERRQAKQKISSE